MNSELTPREHSEMRDTILAGAQRLHSAGQRRMQLIAASVALVLVAGISGGAVATAALLANNPDRVATVPPTPTPTEEEPTPDPTPTVTPPPTPQPGDPAVVPFGGECGNAITDAEATTLGGQPARLSDYRWKTGAETVLGGIDCLWLSSEEYMGVQISVYAYPDDVVSTAVKDSVQLGCRVPEGYSGEENLCEAASVIDGTWLLLTAFGDSATVTPGAFDALFAQVEERLTAYPAGVAAVPTDEWWSLPDCAALIGQLDPAVVGYTKVVPLDDSSVGDGSAHPSAIAMLAGAESACQPHFTFADGSPGGVAPGIAFHPGGAVEFDSALGAEYARAVSVAGADAAVIVPGNNRYEGSDDVLLVKVGVNVLAIQHDSVALPPETVIPLAEAVLALMR